MVLCESHVTMMYFIDLYICTPVFKVHITIIAVLSSVMCLVFFSCQKGRLKICSKSVVFDPKDFKYPILKVS